MIVVIQCASGKQPGAGTLWTRDRQRVGFVGNPALAPRDHQARWARPDDVSDLPGTTWRQRLEVANSAREPDMGLLRAFELYRPAVFDRLARAFGTEKLFILSAGWGLVRADYRLPLYDITFSTQAEEYKQRRPADQYCDFNQLPTTQVDTVVFLGGRSYLPLLKALTRSSRAPVIVPLRRDPGDPAGPTVQDGHVRYVPYTTPARTNWHYGCAERLCQDPSFLERQG